MECERILFILGKLRELLAVGFNWLFGNGRCVCCDKRTCMGVVCRECRGFMRDTMFLCRDRCSVCGKILVSEKGMCMNCRGSRILVHSDRSLPMFMYRGWFKELLFLWKINDHRCLSPFFADLCSAFLARNLPEERVIVPVPPRPGKIRRKGWDQIEELCFFLRISHGFRVMPLLERISRIEQKKLDKEERLGNRMKSYRVSERALELKKNGSLPESVVVVDDVMTTGVTVENCSALLKSLGIARVFNLNIFIVD